MKGWYLPFCKVAYTTLLYQGMIFFRSGGSSSQWWLAELLLAWKLQCVNTVIGFTFFTSHDSTAISDFMLFYSRRELCHMRGYKPRGGGGGIVESRIGTCTSKWSPSLEISYQYTTNHSYLWATNNSALQYVKSWVLCKKNHNVIIMLYVVVFMNGEDSLSVVPSHHKHEYS